jgi:S-DNA-T family DNA segregation ATPase FtsK/SpoIIIE
MAKAAASSPGRFAAAFRALRPGLLTHAYQREAFLVAAIGAGAFYLTALASFSPLDPSGVAASHPPSLPTNVAGAVGATLSGWALFTFGAIAWIMPLPLLATATMVWRRSEAALSRVRFIGWALAVASLCAVAALRWPTLAVKGFDLPTGGVVGTVVATWLDAWLGRIGGSIALATAIPCGAILIMRKSLLQPLVNKVAALWAERPSVPSIGGLFRRGATADAEPSVETAATEPPRERFVPSAAPMASTPSVMGASEPAFVAPVPFDAPAAPGPALERAPIPLKQLDDLASLDDDDPHTPIARPAPKPQPLYIPPPLSVFRKSDPATSNAHSPKEIEATASLLVRTFEDFGVTGQIVGYQPGPVVTVYEYQPDAGIKQSKVLGLIDDLALALKVDSIFIHPVKGKSALGVQVPNAKRESVYFGDIVATSAFRDAESPLTFGMGKTISGHPMCADLQAMPHLLAAGATGSGKSVAINALLCSIIMKAKPEDVRMILVDPKMLELSVYEGIPHLLMPVITDPGKASLALKWATFEMERRYKLMQHACVRNIAGFNAFWEKAPESRRNELRQVVGDDEISRLPYILLVIDELADLMMTAPKDVESSIQRLAQKARASGIHMVLATQRPSVDIITGVIKANLPCRVAFQVVSKHDSRTILDLIGAEKLLGKGDLLLQRPGVGRLERIQGAFISDEEVLNLVAAVKEQATAVYDETIMGWIDEEMQRQSDGDKGGGGDEQAMDDDPKWEEAVQIARTHGVVSASFLQRHLKIGYNRAARIVEFMESRGMVDKADGAKPRKWLGA